jgi:2-deoxy-D-gluconate 3-dehydrogenase
MEKTPITQLIDLTNKTAVVTGGAKGIGLGIVRRLHEAGANITIADLDEAAGEAVASELNAARASSAKFCKTDVSKADEIDNLIKTTVETFKKIDIFVNNAGIFPFKLLADLSEEDFDKIISTNLKGVYLACKRASEQMITQGGGGNIITVTSVDALHPSMAGLATYDASKHGAWGFLKNIALELAPHNIRVNALAPGGVATPGVEAMTGGKIDDSMLNNIPMHRMGDPDEMGRVALFLASDLSSYMTGSQVVADGGMLLS